MKKINQYKLLAGICALALFTACDFEEINTNPFEMTNEMGIRDGVAIGGAVTAMQRAVVPVGTQADDTEAINQYQVAYNLSADSWCGFSDRITTGIAVATILPITYRTLGWLLLIRIRIQNCFPHGRKSDKNPRKPDQWKFSLWLRF